MSEIEKEIKTGAKETAGFINYILTFDKEQKSEIMNMVQYSVLAIIPIMVVLRSVKALVPEDDESKGSLEITAECLLQIIFMMVSIWLTDRIIRYIPTYSKTEYGKFYPINFIIPFLIILITMQSKLGFKINILIERALNKWHGKSNGDAGSNTKGGVKGATAAQAQSANYRVGNEGFATPSPIHQPSQADYLDTSQLLGSNKPGVINNTSSGQPSPDFNAMYQGPNNPMINAESPPDSAPFNDGPLAANAVLGGGFGGSAW